MRFWDSSALLPVLSKEALSDVTADLLREDNGIVVWWGTWIECSVAISRLRRESRLNEAGEEEARDVLDRMAGNWVERRPTNDTRLLAMLISKYHSLVAAALRWCEGSTSNAGFVCLDGRLRRAAQDEGFDVLPDALED